MNRTLAVLLGVVLIGIALLTGGCSILFSFLLFQGGAIDGTFMLIWISGLMIGALALWGAIKLFQSGGR